MLDGEEEIAGEGAEDFTAFVAVGEGLGEFVVYALGEDLELEGFVEDDLSVGAEEVYGAAGFGLDEGAVEVEAVEEDAVFEGFEVVFDVALEAVGGFFFELVGFDGEGGFDEGADIEGGGGELGFAAGGEGEFGGGTGAALGDGIEGAEGFDFGVEEINADGGGGAHGEDVNETAATGVLTGYADGVGGFVAEAFEGIGEGGGIEGLSGHDGEKGFDEEIGGEGAFEGGADGGDDDDGGAFAEGVEGTDAVAEGDGFGGGVFEEDAEAAGELLDFCGGDAAESESGLPVEGALVGGGEDEGGAGIGGVGGGGPGGPGFGGESGPTEPGGFGFEVGVEGRPLAEAFDEFGQAHGQTLVYGFHGDCLGLGSVLRVIGADAGIGVAGGVHDIHVELEGVWVGGEADDPAPIGAFGDGEGAVEDEVFSGEVHERGVLVEGVGPGEFGAGGVDEEYAVVGFIFV